MKILRRIPVAIAVISAMVTVASSAGEVTTLEATPDKIVLLIDWSIKPLTEVDFQVVDRLGAEHCKKYDRVVTKPLIKIRVQVVYVTIPCDGKNKAVDKYRKGTSKESPQKLQSERRGRFSKSWE